MFAAAADAAADPTMKEFVGKYGALVVLVVAVIAAGWLAGSLLRKGRKAAAVWMLLVSSGVSVPGGAAVRAWLMSKGWWPR